MKEISKNKRGISLIVLVITIIVMIILAAAIILSLNSSDIIGKANEAKTSSDTANKKAAASVLLAEYELALVNGETTKTPSQYVKEGLEAQGIDASDIAITEDREILVGLSKAAVAFVEAGVQIGDTVTGYTLSQDVSAKSYTTSGNENTFGEDENGEYVETDPQPATLTRDESITWKYFGIDENGDALIVGSVTSTTPNIILGGKGGFINGPQELNNLCKAMYSSSMGLARSIDIADVTRVLEYTGERGSYNDENDNYIPTEYPKTINEIAREIGYDMSYFGSHTPEEGKNIEEYKSDYYLIGKTSDANSFNSSNLDIVNLIYPETSNKNYWLASQCVKAAFRWGYAEFNVIFVDYRNVDAFCLTDTGNSPLFFVGYVRPVVELSDTVEIDSYDAVSKTVTIK